MSTINSSLAFDELKDSDQILEPTLLLVEERHLSIKQRSPGIHPLYQVVKVKGTLTVSF